MQPRDSISAADAAPERADFGERLGRFHFELREFSEFNRRTALRQQPHAGMAVPIYENEFWTAKQRACHSIHEVSYRACFKPQLPRFFITRFTEPGDTVYDPFLGRGTTAIEAALLGRRSIGSDLNPLSVVLTAPRLAPPPLDAIHDRLSRAPLVWQGDVRDELHVFYHADTLREITALRAWFAERKASGDFDLVDAWIEMVACNRLTGHSRGFFSVYTLPPNQAASIAAQRRINAKRVQTPDYRDVKALTWKKSRQLQSDLSSLGVPARLPHVLLNQSADHTPMIPGQSIALIVTSPPFLNTVDYRQDNWLRAWFCGSDLDAAPLWQFARLDAWRTAMERAFREFTRVLRPGGILAFEVGEIRGGSLLLEHEVVGLGNTAGLLPECIVINTQDFTKTANCWGVENMKKGTNSNRIVVFRKPA